jgi:hypothetical protein
MEFFLYTLPSIQFRHHVTIPRKHMHVPVHEAVCAKVRLRSLHVFLALPKVAVAWAVVLECVFSVIARNILLSISCKWRTLRPTSSNTGV